MTAFAKLLKIIISVEKKGTGAKDAEKELTGVQKAAKLAGAAIATFATVQVVRAGYELAELGAQSIRTKNAFVAISGGAEEAERRLDAMRVATRGALSEQQMMASANRLMQMGLANNAEELGNLTHMATRLGAAMGKEAGPAIEEFALMLANQSIPRLDTFGISAGRTRTRILELMKANEGMTRETAFMTAVMEEGELAMGRLGEETEDAALAFERAKAKSADLKAVLGERLAPVVADLIELTLKGVDAGMKLGMTLEILGMRATGWTDAQIKAYIETESLFRGMIDLEVAAESTGRAIGALTLEESLLAERTEWTTSRIGALTQEESLAAGAAYDAAQAAEAAAGAIGEMGLSAEQLKDRMSGLAETMKGPVGAANREYNASYMDIRQAMSDVKTEIRELEGEQGYYAGSVENLTIAQHGAAQASANLAEAQQALAENTDPEQQLALSAAVARANIAIGGADRAIRSASGGYVDNSKKIGELNGNLDELRGQMGNLEAEHRAAMNSIVFDMMYARLATDGWTEAESELALTVAESMGLIDEDTRAAASAMNEALTGFAGGAGVAETESAIRRIAGSLDDLPRNIDININLREQYHALMAVKQAGGTHWGGPVLVGEGGPELAWLPRGTHISTATETRYNDNRSYQGGGVIVNVHDPLAAALVMEQISNELADEIAIGM